jgi:hypothetical protein
MTSAVQFERLIQAIEPAAVFVEPRILKRAIRLDRNVAVYRLLVSHRTSYIIERERLQALIEPHELGAIDFSHLPHRVLLIARWEDDDFGERDGGQARTERFIRRLYFALVHWQLYQDFAERPKADELAAERRAMIGETEFAEIRSVLINDGYLFTPATDLDVYLEFAAHCMELRYFAPHEVAWYFPAISDWQKVKAIVDQDADQKHVYERLLGVINEVATTTPTVPIHRSGIAESPTASITLAQFRQLQVKAERAAALGNTVQSALTHLRASRVGPRGYQAEAEAAARAEMKRFTTRIQRLLEISPTASEDLQSALESLLFASHEGLWSQEARLLYDLQKACVEQERTVHKSNIVQWVLSLGKQPLDRALPLLGDSLMLRHLRTASRRVPMVRIDAESRQCLAGIFETVLPRIELRSRDSLRGIIAEVFDEVGLRPQNAPERVAYRKVIEELIDQILERSYLNMADLRDALSKNDLKLPDVTALSELIDGDRLLRADSKLSTALDGVYRGGAVYQRFPQLLSSLAFGTNIGRNITKYLAVPYGGAFLTLECLRHLVHIGGQGGHVVDATVTGNSQQPTDWLFLTAVVVLGTWVSFLIHRPDFRAWSVGLVKGVGRIGRAVFVDLPARILASNYVQAVLQSRAFAVVRNYLFRPAVVTGFAWIVASMTGHRWSGRTLLELFLISALFLNSTIGRHLADAATGLAVRIGHELRIRIFTSLLQWTIDLFRGLMSALERIVYSIDESLRFRRGDNRVLQFAKFLGGVVWFLVAYVVIFIFTLLVEPQINPIKHFPVVTVSHKLILPAGPVIVRELTPYLGATLANTLVWTTIWLIPGVCGFLVWELKENWRLYAANRPSRLRPEAIGHHGETMIRLLRPGFHSGTLPKAFAALRRSARQSNAAHGKRIRRRRSAIRRVEIAVERFVQRELLHLLEEVDFSPNARFSVGSVRVATSRIQVSLLRDDKSGSPMVLSWKHDAGKLVGAIEPAGWLDGITESEKGHLQDSIAGLFQRAGVQESDGRLTLRVAPTFTWKEWLAIWHAATARASRQIAERVA